MLKSRLTFFLFLITSLGLLKGAGRWLSPGTPIFTINKADRHDITEILWKVTLNTKNPNPYQKAERIQFFKYSIKCIINNRIVVLPDSRLSYRIIIFILIVLIDCRTGLLYLY